MSSPQVALLAMCLAAPQARAAGSMGEDLPPPASARPRQPPILPIRATESHGGSPPPSGRLRLADLRDPFAPSKLARQIPPGPYPIRVADLKDPFAMRGRLGEATVRPLLPGDIRDPFRPTPRQDAARPGTVQCWPGRSSAGVIIQRPRSLRGRSTGEPCEPTDRRETDLPDLRDPFPASVPRNEPRNHQPPLPGLVPSPIASR